MDQSSTNGQTHICWAWVRGIFIHVPTTFKKTLLITPQHNIVGDKRDGPEFLFLYIAAKE